MGKALWNALNLFLFSDFIFFNQTLCFEGGGGGGSGFRLNGVVKLQ